MQVRAPPLARRGIKLINFMLTNFRMALDTARNSKLIHRIEIRALIRLAPELRPWASS